MEDFLIKTSGTYEENEMKEESNISLETSNNNEIWKVIPNYSNYEASTMGMIRIRTTGRIMTPSINPVTGYANVSVK